MSPRLTSSAAGFVGLSVVVTMAVAGCSASGTQSFANDGGADDAGNATPDGATIADARTSEATPLCGRYLACAAAAAPATLPALQEGYGEAGSCWSNASVATCEEACRRGLAQLRPITSDPACGCEADADCSEGSRRFCDTFTKRCGTCRSSASCGQGRACVRAAAGATCEECGEDATYPSSYDGAACGGGPVSATAIWSSAPACKSGTCSACSGDPRCAAKVNCGGVWECLRNAPVECGVGASCCLADRCSALAPYTACMNERCAGCGDGEACLACGKASCNAEFGACQSSCK